MDSYMKNITIDVNAEDNYTMVKAKQGDKINRKIAITLKKDGENFTPSGVSQIWFRMEKPDGNIAIVKSTDSGSPISVSGNIYTVTLTEQCLVVDGEAWCDLAFLDASGNTLSSAAFVMKIIPMPNGNSATSTSAWTDLQKAIDDAERFANIVAFRTNGNYIQYTVDGQTWVNLVNVGAIGGDLQNQIDDLNAKFRVISSGSINDITESGIYYLTGNVTDKPIAAGGIYIVGIGSSELGNGIYISQYDQTGIWVRSQDRTWSTYKIANNIATAASLGSGDDLNNLYSADKGGFYYVGTDVQNAPFSYGGLINICQRNGACYQLMWSYYDEICYRKRIGNPAAWGEWTYIPEDPYPTIYGSYNEYVDENTNSKLYAVISNNIGILSGYFYLKTATTGQNTIIGNINLGRTIANEFFVVSVSPNGETARIKLSVAGSLVLEKPTVAGQWFSFSMPIALRRRNI